MFIFHIPCHSFHFEATQTLNSVSFLFKSAISGKVSEGKITPLSLCECGSQLRNPIHETGIGKENGSFTLVKIRLENVYLGLWTRELVNAPPQTQKTTGHICRAGLFWHGGSRLIPYKERPQQRLSARLSPRPPKSPIR